MRVAGEGPIPCPLAIVGEAPGANEDESGRPFWGASGYLLGELFEDASRLTGIELTRWDCWVTNVVMDRPEDNNFDSLCISKREAEAELPGYPWPPVRPGKYLRPDLLWEVERLYQELLTCEPTVVLALGNVACWALLRQTGIKKLRGSVTTPWTEALPFKVLPSYHPAYLFRSPKDRAVAGVDVVKAFRETAFPEIRRPKREIWIAPDIQDLYDFRSRYIPISTPQLAVDVETKNGLITCIGFAPSRDHALVIPLIDERQPDKLYWRNDEDFKAALRFIQELLLSPIPKVLQHGAYDLQYCWKVLGCPIVGFEEDTMLMQHAQWPEMKKDLGFLGSIYTNEASWKLIRTRGKAANKREE